MQHIHHLGTKALSVTDTKCLHFPPCCSHKAFLVDSLGKNVKQEKKSGFFFFPLSSPPPRTLSLSINSCIPSLQCPLEIALFSLLKAVLSVNSEEAAKRAEDFSGVAESDRMELWARPGRLRLSSGSETGQKGRKDQWRKNDNATIALVIVKLFSFRSPFCTFSL